MCVEISAYNYFNPRSLAGATCSVTSSTGFSTKISIHAPSRERLEVLGVENPALLFQSTLPRGSDASRFMAFTSYLHFNPRSLAGATLTGVRSVDGQ